MMNEIFGEKFAVMLCQTIDKNIRQSREAEEAKPSTRSAAAGGRWEPLYDGGVWDPSATYVRGCVVSYRGSIWHCNFDATGDKPGTSAHWRLMVKHAGRHAGVTV